MPSLLTLFYEFAKTQAADAYSFWLSIPGPVQGFLLTVSGALAGAWVTSRKERRKEAKAELRAIGAALALLFTVMNQYINLKRQHVKAVGRRYGELQAAHGMLPSSRQAVLQITFDLQSFSPFLVPVQHLEKVIFENLSPSARIFAGMCALSGEVFALKHSLEQRDSLIAEFKNNPNWSAQKKAELYLGLRDQHGHIDERFKTNVRAIVDQTDNCIWFAKFVAENLVIYGNDVLKKNRLLFMGVRKFKNANWSAVADDIPKDQKFAGWLRGFVDRPSLLSRMLAKSRFK